MGPESRPQRLDDYLAELDNEYAVSLEVASDDVPSATDADENFIDWSQVTPDSPPQ